MMTLPQLTLFLLLAGAAPGAASAESSPAGARLKRLQRHCP